MLLHKTILLSSSKWGITFLLIISNGLFSSAQVTLNADGPGNTYELINSVLAPGYNAVEAPDQTPLGSHTAFGRHIAEVWDVDLNKNVFEFYAHLDSGSTGVLDNDVSTTSTDRQRVEIKTYASSPNNLKGTIGEKIIYKWRFKVPVGFQPTSSFTHLHQIKAVGGDESDPIFTLTPRKGTPNKMELIYVKSATSGTDKKVIVNLSLFEGIWVDVTETINIGDTGTYDIIIKRVDNNATILSYSNNNITTIRPDNTFIRPKWGIYRSIADKANMRDEAVRFSDFSIEEVTLSVNDFSINKEIAIYPNPVQDFFILPDNITNKYTSLCIYDSNGKQIVSQKIQSNTVDISFLNTGMYLVKLTNDQLVSKSFKILKK